MSFSNTRSSTFNASSARYLTSKISADLRIMNRLYGSPSLDDIDNYAQEAAELMLHGYLLQVDYGLRRTTGAGTKEWVLQLRYTVTSGGGLSDDHPGGVPTTAPTAGTSFYSYLSYSQAYQNLPHDERQAIRDRLPVTRTGSDETPRAGGTSNGQRAYSRDGVSLSRDTFVAWAG